MTVNYDQLIDVEHLGYFKAKADNLYAKKTDVPTNLNQLTNGPGYQTAAQVSDAISSAVGTAVASAVIYRGSKATYSALPSSSNKAGDMWNVEADNMNYVWNGTGWDQQAPTYDLSNVVRTTDISVATNAQIDALFE